MEIRLFRDGDRDGLISLLRTVFDGWHADPPSRWNWLYERNPAGTSSIGVAVEDGDIVASYSACPVPMQWGDQQILVGLGIDLATHPAFRRRGLFERVAEAAIADAERRGFGFILSYTQWGGASAIGQTQKLGFTRAFMLRRLVKILDWPRALAFKLGLAHRAPTRADVSDTIHAIVSAAAATGISVEKRKPSTARAPRRSREPSELKNLSDTFGGDTPTIPRHRTGSFRSRPRPDGRPTGSSRCERTRASSSGRSSTCSVTSKTGPICCAAWRRRCPRRV